MIGYGRPVVPRSKWGKIGVMIYACQGIPVYILYLTNIGKIFARILKWLYTKAYRWNVKRKWKQAVNFEGLGSDDQLDEAYMNELEHQVQIVSKCNIINHREYYRQFFFLKSNHFTERMFTFFANFPEYF